MGRFEHHDTDEAHLPTSLGTATEDLRSTVETEVAKIVEGAQARAAEIEDRALEKANRIEEGSERRAQSVLQESRERVARMLTEIDGIEQSVGEAVRSLRVDAERLTGEIERAKADPVDVPDPAPPTAPPAYVEVESAVATEPEAPDRDEATVEPDAAGDEVREMIRQQLLSLAEGGRTRADAERMLLRFKEGEQYFDLLNEIYPEEIPGRRGLLRRRK